MSVVLYRKYRASTFAEIHGQNIIVEVLKQAISTKNTSHAYLFSGPRGTGKTTTARLFAKAVNCKKFHELNDVCNKCETCRVAETGTFLDLIEIDAASNRGIEEIRQLREAVNFLPNQAAYKVYIIDEVHMLTREAFNALLKTLEEPPAHVIFILATTEAHKVPVTILSRVQRFDFRLATKEELSEKLKRICLAEGWQIEQDAVDLIYDISGGSYRDAESILGKIASNMTGKEGIKVDKVREIVGLASSALLTGVVNALVGGNVTEALQLVSNSTSQGWDPQLLLHQLMDLLRKDIMSQVTEGANYKPHLNVLSRLISAATEARYLDDPSLTLQFCLLEAASENVIEKPAVRKMNPELIKKGRGVGKRHEKRTSLDNTKANLLESNENLVEDIFSNEHS